MNFRLEIAQDAVIFAEKQLRDWLKAIEKQPGLRSFQPQKEQILRINLEAAREHLANFESNLLRLET